MPQIHLKQRGFNYSAFGPFTKNKERIQKFKETGDATYIYKNELDKVCFQHDMQLLSKFNKGFKFFLCAIDIFSKYTWVVPLKDKNGVSIVDAFQMILDK